MFQRLWPGEGDLDVTGFLRLLDGMGVCAAIGPELNQPHFAERDPAEVIRALSASAESAYAAAGVS